MVVSMVREEVEVERKGPSSSERRLRFVPKQENPPASAGGHAVKKAMGEQPLVTSHRHARTRDYSTNHYSDSTPDSD
jgi:hypothetical protein